MAVTVSAPGKVLITGGYLILEKPNKGIVLTTTARFYAIIKPLRTEIDSGSWAWLWTDVKLVSPQLSKEAMYKLSLKTLMLQNVTSRNADNPYVEQAIQFAVAAAKDAFSEDTDKKNVLQKLLLQGLEITVLGSNDFYSYRQQITARGLPLTSETLALLPPFSSVNLNVKGVENCAPEVAKTGLGSSAAMTTAVVAGLLEYLGAVNLSSTVAESHADRMVNTDLNLVHSVSQAAHCVAQKKIGSGFDVSAAVYGSQLYVRFTPEILSPAQTGRQSKSLVQEVSEVTNAKWDCSIIEYALPPFMSLILGEPGYGGSSTPSMVREVQSWRKRDPENSQILWKRLAEANSAVERGLLSLKHFSKDHEKIYKLVLENCSNVLPEKWMDNKDSGTLEQSVVKGLLGVREAILEVRALLKHMGEAAGVPIEPDVQTELLNASMNMEGVLLAGVPGAGGFDALFAITLGDIARERLARFWSSKGVLALLVREDPKGIVLEDGDPRHEISAGIGSMKLE
eukprot:TRINITY_DN11964_c0_g1_i1.p1 TRINITY_DN11964_c0_g1~~TRINITY_DN11964_c0_g1_i1.p1  ORF type:complete len:570 (+),score=112.74 TRINITY_DN11964_c0_g1_i1:178-1710(+)